MIRTDRSKYPVRAYLVRGDEQWGFWCRLEKKRVIATDVGQEMEGTSKILYTKSRLPFRVNDAIRLTREGESMITVASVDSQIDQTNESARRGNPMFEVRMEVN